MATRRKLAGDIYVAVYTDTDGVDCFAYWGSWGQGKIRWYKTLKEGERHLAEAFTRPEKIRPPQGTRLVKFEMEKM